MSFSKSTLLPLVLLLGCSTTITDVQVTKGRFPASEVSGADCKKSMSSLAEASLSKRQRVKKLKQLSKEGNFKGFQSLLWSSHDNFAHKSGAPLGFSMNRARLRGKLMVFNNNRYIPSYYQFVDSSADAFGVLDILRQSSKYDADKFGEAVDDVSEWIADYKGYKGRLNAKIEEGFEARMQLKVFKEHRKKMKATLEYDDVDGANTYTLDLPWIKDGEVVYEEQHISDLSNIDIFIKDKTLAAKHIFAQGKLDESFAKSEVYQVILSQAYIRRRLTFVRDAIQEMRPSDQTAAHKKLLKEVKEALADTSLLPRSDAIKYVQWQEIKSEIRSFVRTQRSKRSARTRFKYQIAEDVMKQMQDSSSFLTYSKFVGVSVGLGAGFSFVGSVFLPVTENPYYNWFFANINNNWNDMWLSIGLSSDIESCSKEYRAWTVNEACYNAIIFKHTSAFFYRSQFDEDYNYLEDPEFIKKRAELTALFVDKRDKKGAGQFHAQNKTYLNSIGYRTHIDEIMTELVTQEYQNPKVETKLNQLLDAHFIEENQAQVDKLLIEIKEITDEKLHGALVEYLAGVNKLIKKMQKDGTTPRAKHLDEFMQATRKL